MRLTLTFYSVILSLNQFLNCLPCNERFFETGMVCVCNSSYCDTLEFVEPTKIGDVLIFSSSEKGLRFLQSTAKFERSFRFRKHIKLKENLITIDRSKKYQKIIGFGNAMSGAAAINLDLLSVELRNHVFQSYFNKDIGLAFNILRTPIGGTDSDVAPWAYNETPENDTLLSNFNKLDQRDEIKVRFFKDIKNVTNNTDIKYFGATWTPPRWMKSNNNYTGFSYLKPEFYETYALYHIKWLELMRKAGIEFWSISTGNEPMNGNVFSFGAMLPSLGWDPITQGFWIAKYFGPMMNKAFPDIKLVSTDDQIFTFPIWFNAMYGTIPESKSYIKGHVFHYYANVLLGRKALTETYNLYPDKFIILTEAAHGVFPWEDVKGPVLGSWQRAENYIVDIIDGLNNYLNGWIDWNMIMNDFGGPVYTELFADCTIIKSKDNTEIFKQPMFYAIGHFSRFLPPESIRIGVFQEKIIRGISATAFQRPDNMITLIISNKDTIKISIIIHDQDFGVLLLEIPPRSVHTLLYKVEN